MEMRNRWRNGKVFSRSMESQPESPVGVSIANQAPSLRRTQGCPGRWPTKAVAGSERGPEGRPCSRNVITLVTVTVCLLVPGSSHSLLQSSGEQKVLIFPFYIGSGG